MRILVIGVLVLIFVTACNTEKPIGGDTDEHGCLIAAGYSWCESKQKCLRIWEENCTSDSECLTDDDCIIGGCSGTVCQSEDAEPVYTTCMYLPEYECYKGISCGCIDGKCDWEETEEFKRCVEENSG
jgi:eight-cysteine-cluster-containing protein